MIVAKIQGYSDSDLCSLIKESIYVFVISSISLFLLLSLMLFIDNRPLSMGGSFGSTYLQMANNPFQFTNPPLGYRVLSPLIVYILPFERIIGFTVLHIISMSLSASLSYYYFVDLNITKQLAFRGSLMIPFSPTVANFLRLPPLVDPLAFVFIVLGLILIKKNREIYLYPVLFFGILTKEPVLILAGIYFLTYWQNNSLGSAIFNSIPIFITGVFSYMLPRLLFPYESTYTIGHVEQTINKLLINIVSFDIKFYASVFGVYATFWLVLFINITSIKKPILRASGIALIPIFGQILIGDAFSRLLFWGFPFVLPICLMYYDNSISNKYSSKIEYISISVTTGGLIGSIFLILSESASGWLTISSIMIGIYGLCMLSMHYTNSNKSHFDSISRVLE